MSVFYSKIVKPAVVLGAGSPPVTVITADPIEDTFARGGQEGVDPGDDLSGTECDVLTNGNTWSVITYNENGGKTAKDMKTYDNTNSYDTTGGRAVKYDTNGDMYGCVIAFGSDSQKITAEVTVSTVSTTNNRNNLLAQWDDSGGGNGYRFYVTHNAIQLHRIDAGVATFLGGYTGTSGVYTGENVDLELQASGGQVSASISNSPDDQSLGPFSDSTHAGNTDAGTYLRHGVSASHRLATQYILDWRCENP